MIKLIMVKKIFVLFLVAVMVLGAPFALAGCDRDGLVPDGPGRIPDPGGRFLYGSVDVLMVPSSYGGRVLAVEDFPEFPFVRIVQGQDFTTGGSWVILTLSTPSRKNVLHAVYALQGRDDIYYVGLRFPSDDTPW